MSIFVDIGSVQVDFSKAKWAPIWKF